MSWPWCDEMIAVYGKSQAVRSMRSRPAAEMFIDTTPGTPVIYRREALTKMFTVGYAVEHNIFFGGDCRAQTYNSRWATADAPFGHGWGFPFGMTFSQDSTTAQGAAPAPGSDAAAQAKSLPSATECRL